ncbi:MAG: hypothetical protein BWY68_00298 [bacterium ADurb.Bin400]|nr:MAG: hypothetical protein BWY68_00298 [bacterium ADurb.Bin400]
MRLTLRQRVKEIQKLQDRVVGHEANRNMSVAAMVILVIADFFLAKSALFMHGWDAGGGRLFATIGFFLFSFAIGGAYTAFVAQSRYLAAYSKMLSDAWMRAEMDSLQEVISYRLVVGFEDGEGEEFVDSFEEPRPGKEPGREREL